MTACLDPTVRSSLTGNVWPAVPAHRASLLFSLLSQFERTQWWPEELLRESQFRQLRRLLDHAYNTVPFYRRRFDSAGLRLRDELTLEDWRRLPLLTRRDLQDAAATLVSGVNPAQYGGYGEVQTSGSTGEPVRLRGTGVDQLFWDALTLREHRWHGRDLSGKLASIRVFPGGGGEPPRGTFRDSWGAPAGDVYVTGPMALLSLTAEIRVQAQWLLEQDPDYLLTYPTNLAALIAHCAAQGERPRRLRQVRTVGETVTPALRAACAKAWGVPLVDLYSSQELGYIAMQCPTTGQYHVMAESVFVEVLAADGSPSRPGEIGRLVVTKLHNFATPLVRYELRDYAEVGEPCKCGRGLPTLARILGRSRNLLTLPTGEQRWPLVGFHEYRNIAPIRQYQLIQHTRERIEVRLAADRPLTQAEEERLRGVIRSSLGYAFELNFVYFAQEIPRGPGGKFEEFISRLEP
jgi:phenylacetate-CoA ligase